MLTKNKLYALWTFGAISGFTLMISGNTLNFWLASENIDIRTVGIFALISIPYSLNFLWAFVFDVQRLGKFSSYLGLRLSWLCLIQCLLGLTILFLSFIKPTRQLMLFGLLSIIVAFLSAAQDIILGALRTEIVAQKLQGAAAGIYIFGYRIGMLIAGSGAIYISKYLSWQQIYKLLGLLILISPVILIARYLVKKNDQLRTQTTPQATSNNKQATSKQQGLLVMILKPIGSWRLIITIVMFLILYRLPDNFINVMINPFLLHLGYSATEIATTGKFYGTITAIIGGLLASHIMKRKAIVDSLLLFGIIHAATHSLFIVQNIYGKNIYGLFIVISFEGITGGMTMAAYIAFIAALCQGKFRATQYAFFTSMMGFSRSIFPALSGYIVADFGWHTFFAATTFATIPALILLLKIKPKLKRKIT